VSDALTEIVNQDWSWAGISAAAVTAVSPMGHLIVRDEAGAFWYLDPEMVTLEQVAIDETGLFAHMNQAETREVWESLALVEAAHDQFGDPGEGRCYALKVPALLGGEYVPENLCTIPIAELISFTGSLGLQTRDLPDGHKVVIKMVD
jgi:hypothetical protein